MKKLLLTLLLILGVTFGMSAQTIFDFADPVSLGCSRPAKSSRTFFTSITKGSIKMDVNYNNTTNNDSKLCFYNSDKNIVTFRCSSAGGKNKQTFKFYTTDGSKITKIVFKGSNYNFKSGTWTASATNSEWTGNAESVEFTTTGQVTLSEAIITTASTEPVDYVPGFESEALTLTVGDEFALAVPAPEITYTFDPENIVKVENGKVIALAAGKTTMMGKWTGNDTWKAGDFIVEVTVNKKTYTTGLDNEIVLEVGETASIAAGYPADIQYDVDNTGIVTFADGTITAVAPGTAEVYLLWGNTEFEDGEATVKVTVPVQRVTPEISFANESLTYTLEENAELGATVAGQKLVAPEDCKISYQSDNTKVVTVAEDGSLTIVGAGTATITATVAEDTKYYTASKTYTVTVIDPNTVTFDFTTSGAYGWTAKPDNYPDYTAVEAMVTLNLESARYWENCVRVYGSKSTVKLSVAAGYAISEVAVSGFYFNKTDFTFNPSTGSLSGNQKWIAAQGETVTEFSFKYNASRGYKEVKTISVTVRPLPVAPTLHADTPWPSDNRLGAGAKLKYTVAKGFIQVRVVERTAGAPRRVASSVTEQGEAPANWEYLDAKTAVYTHPALAEGESLPVYDVVNVHNGEESVPTRLELTADGGVSGIADVTVDGGDVEYYNLQGVRVENPAPGLYIRRQGDTYTKVLVK